MRHIVFFIAYLYFLYVDFKEKSVSIIAIAIYALVALVALMFTRNEITMDMFIDVLFSVAFGMAIYLLSYFSGEGIGIADGMYFVINGLLLTLKENIMLFLTGLFVAFVIGILLFLFSKHRHNVRLPFMPCCLPAIIGYILCIV